MSMSALQATDRFDLFSTAATAVGASPEGSFDHIRAGDGHPNDGVIGATPDQANGSTSEIRKAVIHTRITEILDGHARKSRGHYNFIQLPAPNDEIFITNRRGT